MAGNSGNNYSAIDINPTVIVTNQPDRFRVCITYTTDDNRVTTCTRDFDNNTFESVLPLIQYVGISIYGSEETQAAYTKNSPFGCGVNIGGDWEDPFGASTKELLRQVGLLSDSRCVNVAGISVVKFSTYKDNSVNIPFVVPVFVDYNPQSLEYYQGQLPK